MLDLKSYPPTKESLQRLLCSGWALSPMTFERNSGRGAWQVCAFNGENRLKVEGATPAEALHLAVEAAAACGMLKGWPRPSTGTG